MGQEPRRALERRNTRHDVHIAEVYLINTLQRSATFAYSFPAVKNLAGITEVDHDIFYIAAGNISTAPRPKSWSIWEIDMRCFSLSGARVRKVTDLLKATASNGLATLSKADHTILVADCVLAAAWRLNVSTGAYSIAISEPAIAPVLTAPVPNGMNGVKIRDGFLYFANTNQGLVCRVPISNAGMATGEVEVLATGLAPDDFDLDGEGEGRPWISQNHENVVSVMLANGTVVDVVGARDQLTVAGPTSCAFGLGGEEGLLYCTTNGGIPVPVNGTLIVGGTVVAIDTKGF